MFPDPRNLPAWTGVDPQELIRLSFAESDARSAYYDAVHARHLGKPGVSESEVRKLERAYDRAADRFVNLWIQSGDRELAIWRAAVNARGR